MSVVLPFEKFEGDRCQELYALACMAHAPSDYSVLQVSKDQPSAARIIIEAHDLVFQADIKKRRKKDGPCTHWLIGYYDHMPNRKQHLYYKGEWKGVEGLCQQESGGGARRLIKNELSKRKRDECLFNW